MLNSLIKPPMRFDARTLVKDVATALESCPPMTSLAVFDGERFLGLLMKHAMDRKVASLFGVPLYYNRPITMLLDGKNLTVSPCLSIEEVARKATSRPPLEVYDDVAVVDGKKFLGVLSVQTILNALAERQIESAHQVARSRMDFLARMSHEIRTPMNAILGVADLLQETNLSTEQEEYVQIFQSAGNVLLDVVNDVLDLSKIEAGQLKLESVPVDLSELIRDIASLTGINAGNKGLRFRLDIPENGFPPVLADPTRLRQILLNLLGNAIKFTEQGEITLTLCRVARSSSIHFAVTDTGPGISDDQLQTIFKPFHQAEPGTTRKYGGTGLGLPICSNLVAAMGGQVQVESTPNIGSRFFFTLDLPAAPGSRETAGPKPPRAILPSAPVGSDPFPIQKILIAEDIPVNRKMLELFLKNTGTTSVTVENGRDALAHFQQDTFDAVLMDMEMPIMDGIEATRQIRAWEQEQDRICTPIIALTAHAFPEIRDQAFQAGCTSYLTKPFKKSEILSALRDIAGSTAA
ncbi:MAG TPA: ATP-binding protein [Desulfomicrobiaceae bacterium]|nr:ATP-binding protein [Desulfomicrobiaceae bacterium]